MKKYLSFFFQGWILAPHGPQVLPWTRPSVRSKNLYFTSISRHICLKIITELIKPCIFWNQSNLTSLQTRWSLGLLNSLPLVLFERKNILFTSSRGPFLANLVLFLKNSSILRHIGHLSSSTWWCRHFPSNGQIFHVHQLWQRLSSLSKFISWFTGLPMISPLKPAVYGNDLGNLGSPPR